MSPCPLEMNDFEEFAVFLSDYAIKKKDRFSIVKNVLYNINFYVRIFKLEIVLVSIYNVTTKPSWTP